MLPSRRHPAGHRDRTCLCRCAQVCAEDPGLPHPVRPVRSRRQGHADVAAHIAEGADLMTTSTAQPRDGISSAIRQAATSGRLAVVGFMSAGFPDRAHFAATLREITAEADVVEIGVPFSHPMADGATIQRASFASLQGGFTLTWLLKELDTM